jgi:glycerate kinase
LLCLIHRSNFRLIDQKEESFIGDIESFNERFNFPQRRIILKIVIAPDSYKGSLSATEVATAMERGVLTVFPSAVVRKVPIADGGEGTVEALVTATNGQFRRTEVSDPLGNRIFAQWGILGDGVTAVIEMAAASGLPLVPKEKRDPRVTTTYGTGELIKAALDSGLRKIIIGIGGSATNDGGVGMACALGVKFLNEAGVEIPSGGGSLSEVKQILTQGLDPRLEATEIIVACDVDNPLCGARGASAVFGPQKGATPEMVRLLDDGLAIYAECAKRVTGRNVAEKPGAGAAGGLGAGLMFFTPAQLKPGVEIVLEAVCFSDLVRDADFVITGEGRTDFQTAFGKAPVGVAKVAKSYNLPVFCLSGGLGEGADNVLSQGIDVTLSICDRPLSLEECMSAADSLVEGAAVRLCRIIRAIWKDC